MITQLLLPPCLLALCFPFGILSPPVVLRGQSQSLSGTAQGPQCLYPSWSPRKYLSSLNFPCHFDADVHGVWQVCFITYTWAAAISLFTEECLFYRFSLWFVVDFQRRGVKILNAIAFMIAENKQLKCPYNKCKQLIIKYHRTNFIPVTRWLNIYQTSFLIHL